jgi:hypothetical protein
MLSLSFMLSLSLSLSLSHLAHENTPTITYLSVVIGETLQSQQSLLKDHIHDSDTDTLHHREHNGILWVELGHVLVQSDVLSHQVQLAEQHQQHHTGGDHLS